MKPKNRPLGNIAKKQNLPQPIWRIGGTPCSSLPPKEPKQRLGDAKWVRGHLSQKIGKKWRLTQNGSHSHCMTHHKLPRAGPTHMAGSVHHLEALAHRGRGKVHVFYSFTQNSHRNRLKLYVTLLIYCTQFLIQPLYGFLGFNLG